MTRSLCAVTLCFVFCACGGGSKNQDAGEDTGIDADAADAMLADGGVDTGTDAGTDTDASVADGDVPDGEVDASVSMDGGTQGPACPTIGTPCGPGDTCTDGFTCITTACNTKVCAVLAHVCFDASDCPSGSACTATEAGPVCRPSNAEVCNDSRDCPAGFVCEGASGSRACVARRVLCNESGCPVGFACATPTPGDASFCVYLAIGCGVNKGCPITDFCSDTDADGDKECGPPEGTPTACAMSGGTGCPTDFSCLDLYGDGQGQCVRDGSTCANALTCGPHGICGAPDAAAPAECLLGF